MLAPTLWLPDVAPDFSMNKTLRFFRCLPLLAVAAAPTWTGCATDMTAPPVPDASAVAEVRSGDDGTEAAMSMAEADADFHYGPHAVDQCDNPIATVTNSSGTFGAANTIFHRDSNGVCRSEKGYCLGDCVTVVVKDGNGDLSAGINIIAGSNLPDPGTCSDIAIDTNDPPGSWDFSNAGACGKGNSGRGRWHNCFVHDVCVWARCTDDNLIAGGLRINGPGGIDDRFCGKAFDDARKDYVYANILISCINDDDCPEGTDCIAGNCRQKKLSEGSTCYTDSDCEGYCQLLKCYDGSEGDMCAKNSDCQDGLTCFGPRPGGRCKALRDEGAICGADSDCKGYCQFLRCWDGSKGDKCGSTSDCQAGYRCKKRCRVCRQKTCQ